MRGERGGVAELLSPPSPQESLVFPRLEGGLTWFAARCHFILPVPACFRVTSHRLFHGTWCKR